MRNTKLVVGLAITMASISGCFLYEDKCEWGAAEAPDQIGQGQRNPQTGECQYFGYPGDCSDPCQPCPAYDSNGIEAADQVTWGYCDGYCESLGESDCLLTSGCRAAYVEVGCDADEPNCEAGVQQFWQCWATDQTGPVQGGGCEGLDAYSCSVHDDCVAIHANACVGASDGFEQPYCVGYFQACAAEPATCLSDEECGDGYTCNEEVVCLPPPNCPDCDAACAGYCVPEATPSCIGDVLCDMLPPSCPDGSTPAILNGCYTGGCIPLDECEPIQCESAADEATCIALDGCAPYYRGEDCSCNEVGCEVRAMDLRVVPLT